MDATKVEQLRAELAEAQRLAQIDPLIQIWNRRAVIDILRRELYRGQRERTRIGVLFVDVDHFKQTNDVYGHAVGDTVLCEVAVRIRATIRPYDHVGRYGGDELLVIVAGNGAEHGAIRTAERISSAMKSRTVMTEAGAVAVTVSIGVAVADIDANDAEGLIVEADRAMYDAKRSGGDCVHSA